MKAIYKFILSKRFVINLAILGLLVIASFIILNNALKDFTLHGESVEVPEFRAYHKSELENLFQELPLSFEIIDSVYDTEFGKGEVVSQIPKTGSKVKEGRKIYLTINSSEVPKIKFPDLKDRTKRQAIAVLETYEIQVGDFIYKPSYCTDCVIDILKDSIPVAPGSLIPKGTKVNLVLGAGESDEFIAVPLLINKSYAEVMMISRKLGINSAVIHEEYETEDDSLNAKVFMQIPKYDSTGLLPLGSQIKVFLTSDYNKIPAFAVDSISTDSLAP